MHQQLCSGNVAQEFVTKPAEPSEAPSINPECQQVRIHRMHQGLAQVS